MSETSEVLTPFELFETYVFTPSKALGLNSTNLKLLVIHAYAMNILTNLRELKIYLEAICAGLQSFRNKKHLPALSADQKKAFEDLYKYCFELPYPHFKLPEPGNLISVYIRNKVGLLESKEFSDRGNIILLYLCNCLFYNDMTGKCSLEHLRLRNGEASPECKRLHEFYEKYNFAPFELTKEMRQDWSNVVQELPDIEVKGSDGRNYTFKIDYVDPECRIALVPRILNYMHALAKICNAGNPLIEIMEDVNTNSPNSMLRRVLNFLAKISLKNPKIEAEFKNIINIGCYTPENSNEPNYIQRDLIGDFKIQLDSIYDTQIIMLMKLDVNVEAADFKFIDTGQEKRELKIAQLLNSKVSRKFLSYFFTDAFDNLYNQG